VFYKWTRNLHLYVGLFVSPFVLLFAGSVFYLNHGKLELSSPPAATVVPNLSLAEDLERLQGRALVDPARQILAELGIEGEITTLRTVNRNRHFVFSVARPGLDATVDVDVANRTATVQQRPTGLFESISYLHKMPGPHNADIRGNWWWTVAWSGFADATVYLILFLSVSGAYLWWVLKAERRTGLALLATGAATFFGLLYAVIR
jgi:hypothetical protein